MAPAGALPRPDHAAVGGCVSMGGCAASVDSHLGLAVTKSGTTVPTMAGRRGNAEARALARDDQFLKALDSQHNLAVRTADELRTLVLVGADKTEVSHFAKGKVDPYLQLMLLARDQYESAEDDQVRLGFFREMRTMYAAADEKTQKSLELAMKERHHQQKMELLQAKAGGEPTEDEVRHIAGGE